MEPRRHNIPLLCSRQWSDRGPLQAWAQQVLNLWTKAGLAHPVWFEENSRQVDPPTAQGTFWTGTWWSSSGPTQTSNRSSPPLFIQKKSTRVPFLVLELIFWESCPDQVATFWKGWTEINVIPCYAMLKLYLFIDDNLSLSAVSSLGQKASLDIHPPSCRSSTFQGKKTTQTVGCPRAEKDLVDKANQGEVWPRQTKSWKEPGQRETSVWRWPVSYGPTKTDEKRKLQAFQGPHCAHMVRLPSKGSWSRFGSCGPSGVQRIRADQGRWLLHVFPIAFSGGQRRRMGWWPRAFCLSINDAPTRQGVWRMSKDAEVVSVTEMSRWLHSGWQRGCVSSESQTMSCPQWTRKSWIGQWYSFADDTKTARKK